MNTTNPFIAAVCDRAGEVIALRDSAPAPVAQLSEPSAAAALMRILKIVQGYLPPNGTSINDAMSQIIACVDPWPGTGFTRFDDLLDDAAEWSGYVEVDTAPYGLKRHLKEVFEKYGITAAEQPVEVQPVAWLVSGPYEKQAFAMLSSAEAYCRGLNKGYGEDAYTITPLGPITTPQPVSLEPLTDAEAEQLDAANEDFCDQGDTAVPHSLLMRFVALGFLECNRFTVTKEGYRRIDQYRAGITSAKQP